MSEEKVEVIAEEIRKEAVELTEKTSEAVREASQKSEETTASSSEAVKVKKSKLDIAKEKTEKAKIVTKETREQIEECMKNIDEEMEKLEAEKQTLFDSALNPAEKLLEHIGAEESILEAVPESRVELVDLDADEVEIKEPSSGRFKGFFWALIAGVALLAAWCYAAAKSLGLAIPPEKFPDFDRLNKMLEWTSEQLGQGANANIGAAAVIVSVLLLMWIIYAVIVSMRATANLKLANETEEAVALYCTSKEECKEKMKLVREHIQYNTKVFEKYKVLLEEQNAKIKRALFFEEAEGLDRLHANTKAEIATTQHLVNEVKKLIASPISEAGVLTVDAIDSLKKANKVVNDHVMKIYTVETS